ncbi:MAG: O-antigen ligase family protein [Candidatus Doudnabacteria bacterium]|nr:O-antigen ligase family protein [Candidatus Doudnabacteria bacterium]
MKHIKIHQILFFIFLFTIPFQTRVIFQSETAYINTVFNYHLGFILYLSDLVFLVAMLDWVLFDRPKMVSRLPTDSAFVATSAKEAASAATSGTLLHIIAFFSLILLTLFHVKHIELGWYNALKWLEMLVLLIYCSIVFKELKMFHVTLWILFISGVFQAIIGIWQFHVQHGLSLGFLGEYVSPIGTEGLATISYGLEKLIRAYGTMPHPNVLAGFLIVSLIAGYYLISGETFRETYAKIIVSCATILIILGLFFSFSRVSWLIAALVTLSFLWFHLKQKGWSKLKAVVIVTLISLAIVIIGYKDLAFSRASESLTNNSVTLRQTYNEMGIELIKKYPVLGVGVGHYIPALRDFYNLEDWQYQPAHNIYIFLAAELGILGLGLFLVIIGKILKLGWTTKNPAFAEASADKQLLTFSLLLAVGSFLLIGLFDHYPLTIQQTRLTFFLLLGMLMAAAKLDLERLA